MMMMRLVEKGAGAERVAVVGEVGEVGRQRPAAGDGRGGVRSRGGIGRSRRRVRRGGRDGRAARAMRVARGPARDGSLVPVLGRRVSNRAGRPREDILRPLGRGRPRAGVELRRGGRRARARAGVARGWARVPRTRARVRRRAGGRERHRARARRRSRGSLLLFLRAGGSASDAGGKKVPGMRRGRATRRRGNGGGGTREARRTLVAGSLGAGSRAACRAGACPPATALCVVNHAGKRRGFSARKKEEGRRSVGGSRMTRFAGLSTREKGRGRTLVFGDAVAFLETPPMVAFDAAFALAAAPPRRRCDVKESGLEPSGSPPQGVVRGRRTLHSKRVVPLPPKV